MFIFLARYAWTVIIEIRDNHRAPKNRYRDVTFYMCSIHTAVLLLLGIDSGLHPTLRRSTWVVIFSVQIILRKEFRDTWRLQSISKHSISFSCCNCHLLTSQLILRTHPPPTYTLLHTICLSHLSLSTRSCIVAPWLVFGDYFTDPEWDTLLSSHKLFGCLRSRSYLSKRSCLIKSYPPQKKPLVYFIKICLKTSKNVITQCRNRGCFKGTGRVGEEPVKELRSPAAKFWKNEVSSSINSYYLLSSREKHRDMGGNVFRKGF